MRKIYYILLPLLIIFAATAAYFVLSKKRNTQNMTLPQKTFVEPTENNDKMIISTGSGDIKVNNLYKNPVANLYHNGVLFQQTPDFEMSFYPDDQGFIISLLNRDLQRARDEAEKAFLEKLGIGQEQACLLKISLGTTADINEKAAGQNYGLSFCPNSRSLPVK